MKDTYNTGLCRDTFGRISFKLCMILDMTKVYNMTPAQKTFTWCPRITGNEGVQFFVVKLYGRTKMLTMVDCIKEMTLKFQFQFQLKMAS